MRPSAGWNRFSRVGSQSLLVLLSLSLSLATLAGIDARKREPVVVSVQSTQFSTWINSVDNDDLEAWVYTNGAGWSAIPFQIDDMSDIPLDVKGFILDESPNRECIKDTHGYIPPGAQGPCEYLYELTGEGPPTGSLTQNDEIVFIAGYAGACVSKTNWVSRVPGELSGRRYRLLVVDSNANESGCVYLYERTGGTKPSIPDLIDYDPVGDGVPANCKPTGTDACGAIVSAALDIDGDSVVDSPAYQIDFYGNWTIDKWMIGETCAGQACPSQDMVDIVKFRIESPGETEQSWDLQGENGRCAYFRGYIDGPVRIVRDVQGAMSGGMTRKVEFA